MLLTVCRGTCDTGCSARRRRGRAAGVVLTFLTLHSITNVGADVDAQYGQTWKNLGAGGWMACSCSRCSSAQRFLLRFATRLAVRRSRPTPAGLGRARRVRVSPRARSLLVIAAAVALFYPPTATPFWQNVLVSQIGIYVLLAIGLNVVVGWAGLLDLGFIAFFAIGSYTAAYLIGPAGEAAELAAWGANRCAVASRSRSSTASSPVCCWDYPTLRLRGDYLAIVTLGFGEIIQVIANNDQAASPTARVGFNIPPPGCTSAACTSRWGGRPAVLVPAARADRRRDRALLPARGLPLGRAWAAIREDEVAAQATG